MLGGLLSGRDVRMKSASFGGSSFGEYAEKWMGLYFTTILVQ